MAAVKKSLSKLEEVFYVAKAVKIIWLKTPKRITKPTLSLPFTLFFFCPLLFSSSKIKKYKNEFHIL